MTRAASPGPSSDPTDSARRALARQMVQACVAALSGIRIADPLCLIMNEADPLARLVGAHVSRATSDADSSEPAPTAELHARPAPRALVLELRADLGEPLVSGLEAPLAEGHMRVLWLTPSQHHVLDVPIEAREVVAIQQDLNAASVGRELGVEGEDELAAMVQERDVGGTWQDPARYVPMPLPAGWSLEGIDRLGVLTVIIEDRLVLELGAMKAPEGELLFAVMRHVMGAADVADDEARAVLGRLRNLHRDFKELTGMGELFGEGRMWTSRVLAGVRDVPGSA